MKLFTTLLILLIATIASPLCSHAQCAGCAGVCLAPIAKIPLATVSVAADPTPDQVQAVIDAANALLTSVQALQGANAAVVNAQAVLVSAQQDQLAKATDESAKLAALQAAVAQLTPAQIERLKIRLSAGQVSAVARVQARLSVPRPAGPAAVAPARRIAPIRRVVDWLRR